MTKIPGALLSNWRDTSRARLRLVASLVLMALAVPLAGCVVEGPGRPGWCAYHPYRCH